MYRTQQSVSVWAILGAALCLVASAPSVQAQQPSVVTKLPPEIFAKVLFFSGDGKTLAVQYEKHVNMNTRPDQFSLEHTRGPMFRVKPRAQGPAAQQPGSTMRGQSELALWDVASGKQIADGGGFGEHIAASPIGILLGTEGLSGITVRAPQRGRPGFDLKRMTIPKGEEHRALALAFDHAGKLLASGDEMAVIRVWSVSNGAMIATLKVPVGRGNGIRSLAFSADGKRLAAGGASGRIDIWDTKTRKILRTLPPTHYAITSLAFTPDGERLVAGSSEVRVWNVANGQNLATWNETATTVFVHPDGKQVVSWGNKTVRVRDLDSGRILATFQDVNAQPALSPDGKTLATVDKSGSIKLLNMPAG